MLHNMFYRATSPTAPYRGLAAIRGTPVSAPVRLAISLVVGVVILLLVSLTTSSLLGVLSGIAGMGVVFILAGLVVLWPMTPDSTRHNARRELPPPG